MLEVPNKVRPQMKTKHRFYRGMMAAVGLVVVALLAGPAQAQEEVEIHGFVSQGYLIGTGNNYLAKTKRGTWEFAEIGINFGTNVSDEMRVGLQLFARDLGDLGNFNFEFDWGFADYTWLDELSLRMGRIKMPYGLYGEYRDLDMVRPGILMPQSVYFESLRDLLVAFDGLQVYGSVDMDDFGLGYFDYSIFGGSIMGPGARGKSSTALFFNNRAYDQGDGNQVFLARDDAVNPYMGGFSFAWYTPIEGLLLKTTMAHYWAKLGADLSPEFLGQLEQIGQRPEYLDAIQSYWMRVTFTVGSIEYTLDDLILAAEYARYYGEFQSMNAPLLPHTDLDQERYYVQASYRLSDTIQISGYYGYQRDPRTVYRAFPDMFLGESEEDKVIPAGDPESEYYAADYSLAIRYDFNDYWLIKFEGHFVDGSNQIYRILNKNHPDAERYWTLFAAKTSLVF